MSKDIGSLAYMECSALTKQGVQELFNEAFRLGLASKKKKDKCIVC